MNAPFRTSGSVESSACRDFETVSRNNFGLIPALVGCYDLLGGGWFKNQSKCQLGMGPPSTNVNEQIT